VPLNLDIHHIRETLEKAEHGSKRRIVQEYADLCGVSAATIYDALRQNFGRQKCCPREYVIPQSLIDEIARRKVAGMNLTRGAGKTRERATWRILRQMEREGCDGIETLVNEDKQGKARYKFQTVNARLEKAGFREHKIKNRIECRYANERWQMDFSRSKYFQIIGPQEGTDDWLLKVWGRELHYKADDVRLRTWIVGVVDDFSRVQDIRAYPASGESWMIGLDMLHRMLNRDEDDQHLLRYCPDRLACDNGSFRKSGPVRRALDALGIDYKTDRITPGNSNAQGKIERRWRSFWHEFELEKASELGAGTIITLSQYNSMVQGWLAEQLLNEHPLYSDSCGAVYAKSVQLHPQNYVNVDIKRIACRIDTRKVDDCRLFSWGGKKYMAPEWAVGKRIRVHQNPNGEIMVESIDEYKKTGWAIPPKEGEKYPHYMLDDFEHRAHSTYMDRIENEVAEQERRAKTAYKEGKRTFMPPIEKRIEVDSPFAAEPEKTETNFRSERDARIYIGTQLRAMGASGYEDYDFVFDDLLGETLDRGRIDQKINDLREVLRRETMHVVKGG
jgi:hypothetical protein